MLVQVQDCPPGHFCQGGFSNFSEWVAPPQYAMPCLPGTYQNDTNRGSCGRCPEYTHCPEPGLIAPMKCAFLMGPEPHRRLELRLQF